APTLRLDELAEHFDVKLDEDNEVDTVGGLVVEKLGRLAKEGDQVDIDGYRIDVEGVDGVRITKLRVIPREPAEVAAENADSEECAHNVIPPVARILLRNSHPEESMCLTAHQRG